MGITVLPPDVNESALNFTPVGNDIRFGMGAIRNVGVNAVDAMVAAREKEGAYTSFKDYLMKVPAVVCNKRTIESLIKAGAFDSLGHHRRALAMIHEEAIDSVITLKRNEAIGQFDLFAGFDDSRVRVLAEHRDPRPARSGRRRTSSRSNATCWASTSRTTRCRAWRGS